MPSFTPCHSTTKLLEACQASDSRFFLWEQNSGHNAILEKGQGFLYFALMSTAEVFQGGGVGVEETPLCKMVSFRRDHSYHLIKPDQESGELFLGWVHQGGASVSHPQSSLKRNSDSMRIVYLFVVSQQQRLSLIWFCFGDLSFFFQKKCHMLPHE